MLPDLLQTVKEVILSNFLANSNFQDVCQEAACLLGQTQLQLGGVKHCAPQQLSPEVILFVNWFFTGVGLIVLLLIQVPQNPCVLIILIHIISVPDGLLSEPFYEVQEQLTIILNGDLFYLRLKEEQILLRQMF